VARVVLACWGSYGDLFPSVGIALALKARGHRPLIATCEFYRALVEGLGLDFHAVPPDVDPADTAFVAKVMDVHRGTEALLREMLIPAVRDAYSALDAAVGGADLIVSHPITFWAPLVAEKRGIRWISSVLAPVSFFSAYDLPAFPPFPASFHLTKLGPTVCRLITKLAKRITDPWMEPVSAFRAELGLPAAGRPLFEGQFSPRMTLALFPRVLAEPQPDWPSNVRRTGFVSYNGPDPMPPALLEFLDRGSPPVVFTLGTSAVGVPGTFFTEGARAASEAGLRGVLLVGRQPENHPAGPLPNEVIAVDYAPHGELFPRAAATVHQAGMGTLSQALRSGKPMLAVPFANDQPDNACRVNRLGVARICSPRRFRSRRVAAHLRALLGEAHYRESAEIVGRTVREEEGAAAACDAIEEALRT